MRRFFNWILVGFALFSLGVIGLIAWSAYQATQVPRASVLKVTLDGPLAETPHPSLGALLGGKTHLTTRGLSEAIRRAAADERITGLLLDVHEPHIGLAQLAEIEEAMAVFRDSGKWNVAYLETAGELGHGDLVYALAACADEIVLSPPGEVGLSGLRADVPFVKGTLERLHVKPLVAQRYEYKNFANTFTQDRFTPEHLESMKTVLDDLQARLLEHMGERRDVEEDVVRSWVMEGPFVAEEAVSRGIVDRLAYWDEVLAEARKLAGRDAPFIEADSYKTRTDFRGGTTAVAFITAAGEITRGEGGKSPVSPSEGIGSDTLAQAFRDARAAGVKAVLFRIDSPGGSYIASDLIRREVELTRKAGIPVVVSMGSVAASGGYFIAVDADYIVAEPETITGSIGVVAVTFAVRQALHDWLGVTFDSYETLPHPGTLSWLDLPDNVGRARLDKSLDRIYKDFVTKVANGRHKTYDEIHKLAKGRIWSGRQAKANGLVDALGGMETAVTYIKGRLHIAKGQEVELQIFPEPENTLTMLRNMLSLTEMRMAPDLQAAVAAVRRLSHDASPLLSPWAQVELQP